MDYGKENRQTAVLRFVFATKIITRGFVVVSVLRLLDGQSYCPSEK
jgi:hypothetical protein